MSLSHTPATGLVLSVFPGIDLLGRAFEEEGYCVVRGPYLLWGGDIRSFHPPTGVFEGVIGGPPCQLWSRFRFLNPAAGRKHGNLIPEYERVVQEAQPSWFLMENVPAAPIPSVCDYMVTDLELDNRWVSDGETGGRQARRRRFSFGAAYITRLQVDVALFESPLYEQAVNASNDARIPVALGGSGKPKTTLKPPTVTAGHTEPFDRDRRGIGDACELQGLPRDFTDHMPFTMHGKRSVIGNGVPMAMGRAIAKAVRRATT